MEDKLWILEDLNMMYIRQIALSLQDTDIQRRIDHEVRMREGAVKLLEVSTQREQALEAAKSLLVCNSRIMTYMSDLQHRKEEQVLQHNARRYVPPTVNDKDIRSIQCLVLTLTKVLSLYIPITCPGTNPIAFSVDPMSCTGTNSSTLSLDTMSSPGTNLRAFPTCSSGINSRVFSLELHRCAVFCALQLRGEVCDTELVFVDRTSTDICFENPIVFSDVDPGFDLHLQLYSCSVDEDFSLSGTPRRLSTKLNSSLGRSSGRRVRAALDGTQGSPFSNGGGGPVLLPTPSVQGPKFQLLAHTRLTLADVQDGFRTHDLTISGTDESSGWLPLYGSVCCRLTAQPDCMNQEMMSGFLQIQAREQHSWERVFCALRGCRLLCFRQRNKVDSAAEPELTISVNKETRIRASDRDGPSQVHSLSITNRYGCEEVTHTLRADSREDLRLWMEAFWQHFFDMSQWKQCCDDLMKIETPIPKRTPLALTKQRSLYHEMAIEGLGPIPDLLSQRMKEFELQRGLDPPPWTSLFPSPSCALPSSSSSSDCDSPPSRPPRTRPRTHSLDAKLTSLKGRPLRSCEEQKTPVRSSEAPTAVSPGPRGSNSSGSSTPESEWGAQSRKSARNLKSRLDPRNWLQSQV
ncbi:rhotekin-like [Xenopus laevis]|uniref:Rhotekin-like n=1 Tax=Xenopus laevis TaxID=8355 RepID=A0A8J1MM73_XENLA|nr:rhotekin-like [Xenopus laevis]